MVSKVDSQLVAKAKKLSPVSSTCNKSVSSKHCTLNVAMNAAIQSRSQRDFLSSYLFGYDSSFEVGNENVRLSSVYV